MTEPRTKIVLVAMSGGVDSSVTALLLRDQGCDVHGMYLRISPMSDPSDAEAMAAKIGVPLSVVEPEGGYARLVDYFCGEYSRGRTPNPCVLCNRAIKFATLMTEADRIGADHIATGHYARVVHVGGRFAIRRGADPKKDQSYVLSRLTQGQLSRLVLPMGERHKSDIKRLAAQHNLPLPEHGESQDVCFVPDNDCPRFLVDHLGDAIRPGDIVDLDGAVVGQHKGVPLYTIGQRKGLGADGGPRYVVAIDAEHNRIVIGPDDAMTCRTMTVSDINWMALDAPGEPFAADVKIRYLHTAAPARVEPDGDRVAVTFDAPQRAVTPGQAAVFYDGDVVLGGGWIEEAGR